MIELSIIHGLSLGMEVLDASAENDIPFDTWIIDLLFIRLVVQVQ